MNFDIDLVNNLNIQLSEYQKNQFKNYFEYLIEYNKTTNLTRITEENEVYYKHFYDSLSLINVLDFTTVQTLCDMGAGAGFPSIPLKIVYPHLKITIIDSLGKRITFLEGLVQKLVLEDVELVHARSEVFALTHQLSYDVVTARALGHLTLILEMGIPMLKVNGVFIAPKGGSCESEIDESKRTIKLLGVELIQITKFEIPHEFGKRTNLLFKKIKHMKGYPRPYNQIVHKPLI